MSSTNTTTHYGLPVYQGTDLAEWTDTNTAFASIDDAVYTAEQNSAQAVGSVNSLSLEVDDLKVSVLGLKSSVLGLRADVNLNTSNITSTMQDVDQAQIDITKLKLDVADLIASKLGSYESEPDDWDTVPTLNSIKPVTSGGVYNALNGSGDSVQVTADGTKIYAQLLNELFALIDSSKINHNSRLIITSSSSEFIYPLVSRTGDTSYSFGSANSGTTGSLTYGVVVQATGSDYEVTTTTTSSTTVDNLGVRVPTTDISIKIEY